MPHDLSPAVERAAEQVGPAGRLADWFLALTADEDGLPASLLQRAGVAVETVRTTAAADPTPSPPAAPLYAAARDWSIRLRGDPAVTTEYLLLAVLDADTRFRDRLAAAGLRLTDLARLLDTLGIEPAPEPPGPEFVVRDPAGHADAARVVDANLNRARESLRVIDDYCRFVLNDAVLTEQVKRARHDLATATRGVAVLAARDTPGDVGTGVTADGEYVRRGPAEVAAVNLKRLQEALRSVEEYGKMFGPDLPRRAEVIRYQAYTPGKAHLEWHDRPGAAGRGEAVRPADRLAGAWRRSTGRLPRRPPAGCR